MPEVWDNGSRPSPCPPLLALLSSFSHGTLGEIPPFRLSEFPGGWISPACGVEEELGMEWAMEKPLQEQLEAALAQPWGGFGVSQGRVGSAAPFPQRGKARG